VPLVAADTDEQADYLATSVYQRILALMRGQSLVQRPPVKTMDGLWLPHEKEPWAISLAWRWLAARRKIRAKLEVLIEQTQADELIFHLRPVRTCRSRALLRASGPGHEGLTLK